MHIRTRGPTLCAVGIALILTGLTGCSGDDSPTAPDTYDPNEYLLALPDWDEYCPTLPDEEVLGETTVELDWENQTICEHTECSLTKTPEDIVTYNPGSEILYLGSLIQGDSYIGGVGSIAELPIRERAPLTITIDLHVPNSTRTVDHPTLATVGDAVHDLVAEADANGHVAGSSIFYNKTETHSIEQSALELGISARYMGATVKSKLSAQMQSEKSTVTAYFVQRMFTTSVVLPDRPGDFFSAAFTEEKLNEQVRRGRLGPDNLPVYVSNIVWGRMMVLTMTSSMESSRMMAALQASYAGMGGSVAAEHLETLQQSKIELVTIGGEDSAALGFLQSGNLGNFFAESAPLTSAVPISYTLRNLSDNSIAAVSETTSYDLVECGPMTLREFTSEVEWRNAVLSGGLALHDFPTSRANVGLADELSGPPGDNFQGTSPWTWSAANTGFPFDFQLTNESFSGAGALVFNDQEMAGYNRISIGDVDDWQDDDFQISVTGTDVYALGLYIGDNTPTGEDMEVWAAVEGGGEEFLRQLGGFNGFVGLVSPVPLRRIKYNEDAGGDDIFIDHFRFATMP